MPLTKKVMILFNPERYQKLTEEAQRRQCSVGALIREAVDKAILEKGGFSQTLKLEAAQRIVSQEEEIADWEEIERLISQGHCE
jgi:predicted DNA-binding ribbon-helix-helix protein